MSSMNSKQVSWLKDHLETFVKPVLGFIPVLTKDYTRFFTPQEMSVIKQMWRSVRQDAKGRPILLAGRDVFVFEILARRELFPTVFRPDISRLSVESVKEDYSKYYILDTGFNGTIPMKLGSPYYMLASSVVKTDNRRPLSVNDNVVQVFPRLKGARSLALKIERTPKYWKTGFVRAGLIGQEFGDKTQFLAAANLTIEVYTDNSPRFSEQTNLGSKVRYDSWIWSD